jgi:cellulose biosynthesis protein BcsQ/cell division protein FtsB
MSVDIDKFYELFEKMHQRGQIPSFLCGVLLGVVLVLLILRLTRGRLSPGLLVRELRDQIVQLTAAHHVLKEENEGSRDRIEGLEGERALLRDKVKAQEGSIETLRQQTLETSAVCERQATEHFDVQEKLKQERKIRRELQKLVKRYSDQLDDVTNSDGKIWLKPTNGQEVPFLPLGVRRTAIISLANLKGGVGKTTITANLGAALALEGLRVLMIDLDHQSSLTNLCLLPGEKIEVKRANRYIDNLFTLGGDLSALNRCVTRLQTPTGRGQLYLAPTEEAFADIENQLMTRWHSGLLPQDVRFRLRTALHSPQLRESYDVVLIDCPPRLTTGCVNALAASDYVLIPVLLEDTSAEAVPRILGWLKRFQTNSCVDLNVLGVVGNKADPRQKLIARERVIWENLREKCRDAWGDTVHQFDEVIREHSSVTGRFACLDPKYQDRYQNLVAQIRTEIPHARLQPSEVHSLAGSPADGGRD